MLFKSPEAALVTGGIGGALEVLKMTLVFRELSDKFHSFTKDSPLALIHELEQLNNRLAKPE